MKSLSEASDGGLMRTADPVAVGSDVRRGIGEPARLHLQSGTSNVGFPYPDRRG